MSPPRGRGQRSRGGDRPPAGDREPRDAGALNDLRYKYTELCRKYEELVARESTVVSDRVGTVALALSAMKTRPSALALADSKALLFTNVRWTELARSHAPLARISGTDVLPARGTLREITDSGTSAVLAAKAPDALAARYESATGEAAWDIRFERTRYNGRAVAMVVASDATDALRSERELEAAQRRISEQERLRTVGLLAAGIAHDFANALNAAGMHLGFLATHDAAPDEPVRRHVHAVQRILTGMAERAKRLRELALERHELAIERVELGTTVAAAVELARSEFRSRCQQPVEIELHPEIERLPPVRGAGAEIVHLLVNLLLNARDAMPEGGTIHICGAVEPDAVVLAVADEGPGIPHEQLTRVFEPFFTTKGEGGTGLGLATAYGLMRTIEGEITAVNRPTGGAVFSLRFRRWG